MFDRIKNLMSGMVSSGVNKMETPEVLLEQAEMELQKNVKSLREAQIESIANEKMLEKQIQKTAEEFSTWEKRAALAVSQNNDAVATECLKKKQELGQVGQQAQEQLAQQKASSANLKASYAAMDEKLKEFLRKKPEMLNRIKAGDSLTKANELLAGTGDTSMDKWEAKIREKELQSDPLGTAATDQKFKELDKNVELNDELAALKAKMGVAKPEEDVPLLKIVEVKPDDSSGTK